MNVLRGQNVCKAVLYARVSSKEQEKEGFSIPAQWKLLRTYAAERGFIILKEYVDIETAKRAGRTGFTEMVDFFQEGVKIQNARRDLPSASSREDRPAVS